MKKILIILLIVVIIALFFLNPFLALVVGGVSFIATRRGGRK